MRYWVYINDKVDGPYDEDKLAVLDGFTPDTLICSEEIEEGGNQEWVKASSVFEFDEATKTMTRAPLTQEELDTVRGNTADVTATSPITQVPAGIDTSATQILIEKIDFLTREIESLKTKLDAALSAGVSAPQQAQPQPAPQAAAAPVSPLPQQQEPVTEEAVITNTESLVNHAEQLVAQASSKTEKPVDFLDEIQIGASKTENLAEKGGEEVVLRSALDSLYNTKAVEQTEEEKEATFQDLLSSAKVITEQNISAEEQKPAEEQTQQEAAPETKQEPSATQQAQQPAEPQAATPQAVPAEDKQEQQPVTPAISEEKREEIINEITAPAQQDNLILQAISDAQKEEEGGLKLAEEAPAQQEPAVTHETAEQPQPADLPSLDAEPTQPAPEEHKEKESLDLTDQPQLSIVNEEPAEQPAQPQQPQEQPMQDLPHVSDELTPMDPSAAQENVQKEVTETIKELVPGKKIEPQKEEDGLISQADLDEAFTEHTPAPEFPIPQEQEPAPAKEEEIPSPAEQTASLPEGKGFYNPNDMTEVELKEGSTYLISDFIPPAQATPNSNNNVIPQAYGAVPGSAEAAQASADNKETSTVQVQSLNEAVEEIVPSQKADQADLTMSKVVLENTIKTKRGATMDIKTVPMVQEPASSDRLDLSDSGLADINTQHDLKAADIKQGNKNLTKMVLGGLVSVVILVLIYVMLAYLELIPAGLNFIKSAPAQTQVQQEDLNEMLGTQQPDAALPAQGQLPQQPANMPQQGYAPNMQGQMPAGALPAQQGQMMPGQPGQMPQGQMMPGQTGQMMPGQNPNAMLNAILTEVKNLRMSNGQTLEQLINSRHPAAQNLIEWTITTAVEPDNYSILVKVPPENPQSFKIPYRFNYNTVTKALEPTISDSKNLLDSLKTPQPVR